MAGCARAGGAARVRERRHKQTIAEFVENDDILKLVGMLGVDHAQEYEIARPLPVDEVLPPRHLARAYTGLQQL